MHKKCINQISNRQYILSPTVEQGIDKESDIGDFFQEDETQYSIGKLGLGMTVTHKASNSSYTVNHFEKEKVSKFKDKINSTLKFMYNSSHPYLFRLLNHFETQTHVFLIFEHYKG